MPNFDDIDLTDVIMDGDPYGNFEDPGGGGGGGEGHTYDFQMSEDNSSVELTEDGTLKTAIPVNSNFVGTREKWNSLSETEKSKYLTMDFKNDEVTHPFSFVGMVVESTTLATLSDVQNIYGSNTSWIQHTGYVLRGADSGVIADQVQNDGGADSVTVSSVASHNHGGTTVSNTAYNTNNIYSAGGTSNYVALNWAGQYIGGDNKYTERTRHSHTINAQGSDYTVNTLPKYKNVYIWERIS